MNNKRVTLVTCVWQRRALTRAFLVWCLWLKDRWAATHRITLDLVAAASDPLDADLAQEFGARVVIYENRPLAAKFNAALTACRDLEPAWVLVMGSDDFFNGPVADALGDAVLQGRSVGFQDLYVGDLRDGRVRYWCGYRARSRHVEPVGCGTLHSRSLLDAVDWRLWCRHDLVGTAYPGWHHTHHGMDHSRFRLLAKYRAMPELLNAKALGGVLIDVKSDENLWPFDRTRKQPVLPPDEWPLIWSQLPLDVVAALPLPEMTAAVA